MKDSTICLDTEKVKSFRERKGNTQTEVADLLNIEQSTYSKVEKGITKIDLERLMRLSEILSVTPAELLNFREGSVFNINDVKNLINGKVEHFYSENSELNQKVAELERLVKELIQFVAPKNS
jgi:transcriptional regulator with XRE-family HTH domain